MNIESIQVFQLLFYALTLIVLIHSVVFAYHWYSFGAEPRVSVLGSIIFIGGEVFFLLILASFLFM